SRNFTLRVIYFMVVYILYNLWIIARAETIKYNNSLRFQENDGESDKGNSERTRASGIRDLLDF
ncbi:MAG: hypothetical protein ACP5NC_07460, partial [Nitrososphaeria archaeon]